MEDNDLRTVSRLAMTCMLLAEKADELVTCVCILQDLSETLDDYIPVMATEEVVTKLCKIVEIEEMRHYFHFKQLQKQLSLIF